MARVTVVVIVYNDAENVPAAVESALAQGPDVGEVVVVDDHSTDGTLAALARFDADPRVRVVARTENSGGCGTPRNDGTAAASLPYLMYLDSDDVLPPGAVSALLPLAEKHGADVVAAKALRRELPGGRTTVWAPELYDTAAGATLPGAVLDGVADHPELLRDTLSVNKLYRRAFLGEHGVAFPDGAFHYEDFVFTGRLYAAGPRLVVADVPVYVWQVRRQAEQLSISLRRAAIANWQSRIAAHRAVVEVFRAAGDPALTAAAEAKFLDYDLPMYLRELPQRDAAYRAEWWRETRAYLAGFDAASLEAATAPARWSARALLALPELPGAELTGRLVELSVAPPRLVPPYHGDAAHPVLGAGDAAIALAGLAGLAPGVLPVTVEGRFEIGAELRLRLRVHDLYGRLAALGPVSVRAELTDRSGSRSPVTGHAALTADGDGWTGTAVFRARDVAPEGPLTTWAVRAEVGYGDGSVTPVEVRSAVPRAPRPAVVLLPPGQALVVHAQVSARRTLLLRTAGGLDGIRRAARKVGRRLVRH